MLQDLLKEAIVQVAGKPAEEMVPLIHSKNHVNEFNIAKKMGLTINQTRNLLYKISSQNLVSSTREKDEKKGWYTYFWKIDVLKTLKYLRDALKKRENQIESQVNNRENNHFYTCERCMIELSEEKALMYDFTCNECGNVLSLKDNTKVLRALKKNLTKYKNKIKEVDEEIGKEERKLEKEKAKQAEEKNATAKRSTKKKSTAKKKTTKKKSSTKKASKKKSSAKKTTTKKPTTKKAATKRSTKKKSTAKKKTTKKESSTKKSSTKKASKKAPAKKESSTKKTASKKKTAAKKATKKSSSSPTKKKSSSKKKTTKKGKK